MQVRFDRVHALFLQFISAELVAEADSTTFLAAHVKEHAAVLADELHGGGQLFAAIATQATKDIARQAFAVYAHVHRLAKIGVTRDPCHMFHAVSLATVSVGGKVAVLGLHMRSGDALHELLVFQAIIDEVVDRDNLEVKLLRHFLKLRHASHGAVFVHDFDQGGRRAQARQLCQVYSRFSMACATEYALFLGVQGRNMPRPAEVAGLGIRVRKGENRRRTVVSGYTRGAAFNFIDHDGKRRSQNRGILGGLPREVQFMAALDRERCAKHATTFVEHEVHLFRRNLFGGDDKVAFVFAVFVIDHNQKLAVLKIFDGLFNRIKQGHVPSDNFQYTCRACRLPHSRWFPEPSCAGSCGPRFQG